MKIIEMNSSFDPVLDDYAFFASHSTEMQNDIKEYSIALESFKRNDELVRMMDFGSGTGTFANALFKENSIPPSRLDLTLIEPGLNARTQAMNLLRPYADFPIRSYAEIPVEHDVSYDLIIANHVLYFVSDLLETIKHLTSLLSSNGNFLFTISGQENVLIQIWSYGFGLIGVDIPYHIEEDLHEALKTSQIPYDRKKIDSKLTFPDTHENRMKIFRFLFGGYLTSIPTEPLLRFFDEFIEGDRIVAYTGHYFYQTGSHQV